VTGNDDFDLSRRITERQMRRRSGMMQSPQAYISRSGYLQPDIGQWRGEPQRNAGVRRTIAGEIAVETGRYVYPAIMIAAGRMELQPGQISGDCQTKPPDSVNTASSAMISIISIRE
jgi:hypothetical protein